jgi:RNA polymerase sigma factor (sigma-70 family)
VEPGLEPNVKALNQRFRPALMAFFVRRLRDHGLAEDLTQETLMRVVQRAETIDPARPDAYIFQIAANLLRDRARRMKVRTAYLNGAGVAEGARVEELDPHRVVQARQSLATVTKALQSLPERTRTIFVLFRLEGMKQRDIADMLGVSIRTVEQHVVRASVHLREKLGNEE